MEQNQTYRVDTVYYAQKYGLEFLNQREAIEHFLKIGKQKGYFPNRNMEIYYQKTLNFDPDYYRQKYHLQCSKDGARKHWEDQGIKDNYFVNICEETNTHQPLICKCKEKRTKKETLIFNDHQSINNHTHPLDKDDYVFVKKRTNDNHHDYLPEDHSNLEQLSKDDQDQSHDQNQDQNQEQSQNLDQNLDQNQDQNEDQNQNQEQLIKELNPRTDSFILLNKQTMGSLNQKKSQNRSKVIYDSKSMTHNHRLKLNKFGDKRTTGPLIKKSSDDISNKLDLKPLDGLDITDITNKQNRNIKQSHVNDFENEFIDCGYRVVLKTINIEVSDFQPKEIHQPRLPNDHSTIPGSIDQKISEINDVLISDTKLSDSQSNTVENNLATIRQNILNIKSHINMSNIYSDTYESIIKEAYQSIKDCDTGSFHISYIKLSTMLKDADNMIQHSQHNKLPIFCKVNKTIQETKFPTNIKFPLLICRDDQYNQTLVDNFGKENIYFKIPLMKLGLDHTGLRKYLSKKFTQVNEQNKSIIKSSLEDAMIKISAEKELMNSHLKRIEIKEQMVFKVIQTY
jgi:hypothetical protein